MGRMGRKLRSFFFWEGTGFFFGGNGCSDLFAERLFFLVTLKRPIQKRLQKESLYETYLGIVKPKSSLNCIPCRHDLTFFFFGRWG